MAQVAFGLFDWIDRGQKPLQQLYEERLRLVEAADAAGFFCYHVAEHHNTPLGMAPSPALFLTAAARQTRRIRLGPLVYLLPLYHPLWLLEEICMLDHLSGGRLELGVGRGVSPYELACFGVEAAESRAIFQETLAVLVAGMTHDRLTFVGQHYQYRDAPIEIHPLQQPYPPLWYPTHNPESIEYAARQGYNFVGLGSAALVRQQVDGYRQVWQAHQHESGRLNGHVASPKIGVMRQIVMADSNKEALEIARPAHDDWYHSITKLWHTHNDHSVDGLFAWDTALEHQTLLVGSPARVREQVVRLLEETGCNYMICSFAWGTLTGEQALRSLRLFAQEVMPAVANGATR